MQCGVGVGTALLHIVVAAVCFIVLLDVVLDDRSYSTINYVRCLGTNNDGNNHLLQYQQSILHGVDSCNFIPPFFYYMHIARCEIRCCTLYTVSLRAVVSHVLC